MSRIIVIEDTPQNSRLAAKLLQHAGHEVIVAEDGEMGINAVLDGPPPDLGLVDLGLPDLDGQTVAIDGRQARSGGRPPVWVLRLNRKHPLRVVATNSAPLTGALPAIGAAVGLTPPA